MSRPRINILRVECFSRILWFVGAILSVSLVSENQALAAADVGSTGSSVTLKNVDLTPWPTEGAKLFPSPRTWADQSVYSVMIDRFSNGDPSNDCANFDEIIDQPKDIIHGCQGINPYHFHGGDIKGLTARLDYIANLGFTTILVTPVTKTYGEYHGYAPYNFLDVDRNFGTMADFREFVRQAHKRGIYVLLDIVINHTAPVFLYDAPNPFEPPFQCRPFDETSRIPVKSWIGNELVPKELKNLNYFSRCGRIANFDEPFQSENGDFLVYRDLASWRPEVADIFVQIFNFWVARGDVDGFRLDALKHVDRRFLARLMPGVRQFAASVGKNNVYFVGEAVALDYTYMNSFLGKNFSVDGKPTGEYLGIDGVYDTAAYYSAINSLKYIGTPLYNIESVAWVDKMSLQNFGQHALLNFRYLDVLDTRRYLDYFPESKNVLRMALPWIFTSVGMPLMTYGTEQDVYEIKKMKDKTTGEITWNVDWLDPGLGTRADMLENGLFRNPFNEGVDLFREDYTTYLYVQKLNVLRQTFGSLRRGSLQQRYYEKVGTGIYAFSRVLDEDEVVVVMNNAKEPKSASFTGSPLLGERDWIDVLDPTFTLKSTWDFGLERFDLAMAPMTTHVLVKQSQYQKYVDALSKYKN